MLGRLAAQLSEHLLKPAHACFAGVAADDRIKRFIVHDQLISLRPCFFICLDSR